MCPVCMLHNCVRLVGPFKLTLLMLQEDLLGVRAGPHRARCRYGGEHAGVEYYSKALVRVGQVQ